MSAATLARLAAKYEQTRGVTTTIVGDTLTVYLDDACPGCARMILRDHLPTASVLDYIGAGMVRVTWPVLVDDVHVEFTDTDDLNEWMHRVNDIRKLPDAELAEYAYDDTGAEDCEVPA